MAAKPETPMISKIVESVAQPPGIPKLEQSLGPSSGRKPSPYCARMGTASSDTNPLSKASFCLPIQDSRSPVVCGG